MGKLRIAHIHKEATLASLQFGLEEGFQGVILVVNHLLFEWFHLGVEDLDLFGLQIHSFTAFIILYSSGRKSNVPFGGNKGMFLV